MPGDVLHFVPGDGPSIGGALVRDAHVAGVAFTGGTDTAILATIAAGRLPWLTKPADPNMIAQALAQTINGSEPGSGEPAPTMLFPERSGAA